MSNRKLIIASAQHWYDSAKKAALEGDYSHALLYFENAFNHTENALAAARRALKPFGQCASGYHSHDGQHDYLDSDKIKVGAFKATVGDLREAARHID